MANLMNYPADYRERVQQNGGSHISPREWNEIVLNKIDAEDGCKSLRFVDRRLPLFPLTSQDTGIEANCVRGAGGSEHLRRLGAAVGNSARLGRLEFLGSSPFDDADHAAIFFEGLRQNSSIRMIGLVECDLSSSAACDLFNALGEGQSNLAQRLERIYFHRCPVGNGAALQALARALRRCTNLTDVDFGFTTSVTTDVRQHLEHLVQGMRAGGSLSTLKLGTVDHLLDRRHCETLVPLIQDPNSKIDKIDLCVNNVNYGCTKVLAQALVKNDSVTSLGLSGNVGMRLGGWGRFSKLLCDTSSIESIYRSNHTLYYLQLGGVEVPSDVSTLLRMNSRMVSKKQIAMQKILLCHTCFDMKPLLELDLKCLPLVIKWLDRARPLAQGTEANVDAMKLDAIYQFTRALPDSLESFRNGGKKRKRGE